MSNLKFSDDAWDDYVYWQMTDKDTCRKILELLKDIDAYSELPKEETKNKINSLKEKAKENSDKAVAFILSAI